MLGGNRDSCLGDLQRQSVFPAKLIQSGGIKKSVSETVWLGQVAGQEQSLLDSIQSLIRSAEKPQRPRGIDLRCNSGVLRVTQGIVATRIRIVESERSLKVIHGRSKFTEMDERDFHREFGVRQPFCHAQK